MIYFYINWILDDHSYKCICYRQSLLCLKNIGAGELDNAIIIMQYASGILANINISRISKNYDQRIEIYGLNGKLCMHNPYIEEIDNDFTMNNDRIDNNPLDNYIVDTDTDYVPEYDDELTYSKPNPISFPQRYDESYKNELIHFFNVIEKKEPLKVHMNDSIACVRIIEACEKSFQKFN